MIKVAFHTLGCKLNFAETSTIARQFVDSGYERVPFNSAAEVYVINTCSVTENADKECKKIVQQALKQADSKMNVTCRRIKPGESKPSGNITVQRYVFH